MIVYLNPVTKKYSFAPAAGFVKVPGLILEEGYKVERSVIGVSPCGNIRHGDLYIYCGDDDSEAWTCQEAIDQGIACFEDEIKEEKTTFDEVESFPAISLSSLSLPPSFYQEAALDLSAYQVIGDDWMK